MTASAKEENNVVCQRGVLDDFPRGSVSGKCCLCGSKVVIIPATQQHISRNQKGDWRIICFTCYEQAPDKRHVRRNYVPVSMVNRYQNRYS